MRRYSKRSGNEVASVSKERMIITVHCLLPVVLEVLSETLYKLYAANLPLQKLQMQTSKASHGPYANLDLCCIKMKIIGALTLNE